MTQPVILTEIVKRAMVDHVTNIGQLSKQEVRELDAAVRKGYLSKGKGGAFPAIKTLWACPGFDFAAHRVGCLAQTLATVAFQMRPDLRDEPFPLELVAAKQDALTRIHAHFIPKEWRNASSLTE
jgi:hypothetical protein